MNFLTWILVFILAFICCVAFGLFCVGVVKIFEALQYFRDREDNNDNNE